MRWYVAGRTTDKERICSWRGMLQTLGETITYDWTFNVAAVEADSALFKSPGYRKKAAVMDRRGVETADVVIAFVQEDMTGTLIEIGMALMLRKTVWIVGDYKTHSVFYALDEVTIMREEDLRAHIQLHVKRMAREFDGMAVMA